MRPDRQKFTVVESATGAPDRVRDVRIACVPPHGFVRVYEPAASPYDRDRLEFIFAFSFAGASGWPKEIDGRFRVGKGGWARATSRLRPEVEPVDPSVDLPQRWDRLQRHLGFLDARNLPRDRIFEDRRVTLVVDALRYGTLEAAVRGGHVDPDDYFLGLRSVEVDLS